MVTHDIFVEFFNYVIDIQCRRIVLYHKEKDPINNTYYLQKKNVTFKILLSNDPTQQIQPTSHSQINEIESSFYLHMYSHKNFGRSLSNHVLIHVKFQARNKMKSITIAV